jgi:hypothetical protein
MTRDEVRSFLISSRDKTKEEVVANFSSFCVVNNLPLPKIAKAINDLKSFSEWTWGE